jgi:hypothetical protein
VTCSITSSLLVVPLTFTRKLSSLLFGDVYNARRTGGQLLPSVTVRAVIVANGHLLADTGEHEVMTDGPLDFSRLPFSGEINLEALPPGLYSPQVTATDRADRKSVTQLAKFSIR